MRTSPQIVADKKNIPRDKTLYFTRNTLLAQNIVEYQPEMFSGYWVIVLITCFSLMCGVVDVVSDLVSNVSCTYYAVEKMNCTWNVVTLTPDLQFFYNNKTENILQPCVIYIGNGHTRTGCHLYGEEFLSYDMLYISFTGSYEGRPIKNMFLRNPGDSVTSQPPKFNITMKGDNLVIQSSHPNFKENCWLYYVHVSKCNEDGQLYTAVKDSNWSVNVPYDESCQYRVRVKANYTEFCGSGASDWSEIKEYGANNDPNLLVKAAAIVIPISISCCLIIALMLFRRHKDKILPKVPEPSLLFRDMFNDNKENKMSKELHVGQLYVPSEELVEAKLHVEPKSTLLHLEG
ncbi:interleukin-13 receptor subunit alpha-1 isoform X2 [Brachyhypopomus gauderio]|uniref:interleukin-13 receptor subunit alpha-1 isoform X2 n=1 Tax=Brachyhypopomus gauderio TaxID=698409 RepID=UPI004041B4ED